LLANVCGYALQLERLESSPAEQSSVEGSKFSKVLRQILDISSANWLLLESGGVLTYGFV
jgi:hypothetical protein